jgi:regulator of ribosome biosynthesis
MDTVTKVSDAATAKQADQFESVNVEKHLELEYDLGTLLAVDTKDLHINKIRFLLEFRLCLNLDVTTRAWAFDLICYIYFRSESWRVKYLKDLARDNAQLLLNKIWELPTETVEAVVGKLTAPTLKLSRENTIPKPKPQTNWQKYAHEKEITKPKKSKLAGDQTLQVSARKIFVKPTW